MRGGHRLLRRPHLLTARRLPGPAAQLHLPLCARVPGSALRGPGRRVRRRPVRKRSRLFGFGRSCSEKSAADCRSRRCANGGSCVDLVNGYDCVCPLGE
ncbi:hypothetical protein CRUP_015041 [Coryphaenoides rupestris]|nr:hypothetical protein CRUP_015041 [Coryphaenoides rupestris]